MDSSVKGVMMTTKKGSHSWLFPVWLWIFVVLWLVCLAMYAIEIGTAAGDYFKANFRIAPNSDVDSVGKNEQSTKEIGP